MEGRRHDHPGLADGRTAGRDRARRAVARSRPTIRGRGTSCPARCRRTACDADDASTSCPRPTTPRSSSTRTSATATSTTRAPRPSCTSTHRAWSRRSATTSAWSTRAPPHGCCRGSNAPRPRAAPTRLVGRPLDGLGPACAPSSWAPAPAPTSTTPCAPRGRSCLGAPPVNPGDCGPECLDTGAGPRFDPPDHEHRHGHHATARCSSGAPATW